MVGLSYTIRLVLGVWKFFFLPFSKFLFLGLGLVLGLGLELGLGSGLGFDTSSPIVCELVLRHTQLSFPLVRFRHSRVGADCILALIGTLVMIPAES